MADETDIPGGVVHDLPGDLRAALQLDPEAMATWDDITPLARNEWICWIESAKKLETRRKRIDWGCSSLREGKRRPCCWPGCSHRQDRSGGA
ncbi:MAG: YdeI/OmpD-associated family protein [Caulobacteraceae bacterium]